MTADLIAAMLDLGKPVFGICRGLQELNVAFGGALRRDASRADELLAHHAPDEAAFDAMFDHHHDVALSPGGVLSRGLGRASLSVNSVHYQAIDTLGAGLTVEATAPDGVVEAVSARVDDAQVLAVQWHPEWRTDANPDFPSLFPTARPRTARRAGPVRRKDSIVTLRNYDIAELRRLDVAHHLPAQQDYRLIKRTRRQPDHHPRRGLHHLRRRRRRAAGRHGRPLVRAGRLRPRGAGQGGLRPDAGAALLQHLLQDRRAAHGAARGQGRRA